MTRTRFADWVAARFTEPAEALAVYFDDLVHAAASVGATLDHLPELDGVRHFLPNAQGRNDKKQFYVASIDTPDRDGTLWPAVTIKSYKGQTVYWRPRDRAFQEFMADRGAVPANDNARKGYRAAAAAAVAASKAKAAAHEQRQAEGRAAAAAAALTAWDAAEPSTGHPYLESKGVQAHGLRVASQGLQCRLWNDATQEWQTVTAVRAGDLLVPMRDEGGHLVNVQRIDSAGKKRFLLGGRAHGCHHRIAGTTGRTVLCEGYATGATWHAAMGDSVIVAFSAGALAAVAAYIAPNAVAADNDESKTGETAAKTTGLPFYLPPEIGDWNDFGQAHGLEAIRAAVANDNAPAFTRPYAMPVIELEGREQTWWNKLSAATTAADAAAIAWAIARRLVVRVPVLMSLSALMGQLRAAAPAGTLNPATLEAIRTALARVLDWRKRRALAGVSMSAEALARHQVETVSELTPGTLQADDYQGVILLNTPMGSGKTEHVGRPFARWSRHQDARFVATCHRQSLVAELARMLGTDHYQGVEAEEAWSVDSLATCLPSIVKDAHSQIIREAGFLFVDEIAQVLRSVAGSATVADKKTRADVFRTLRDLVGRARCIIGADAGMDDRVLAFLENCRQPGERFRIIQQQRRAEDLAVSFGFGPDALSSVYGQCMARLSQGERLWIACGEKTRAMEAARILAGTGARVLLLHGDNRGGADQTEFWSDPEGACLKWDVVVASPVVSSGLSIKHRGMAQHFTHGLLLASGATITPADAIQMLRRVRYLRSWTVAVLPNNAHDIDSADAILAGMEQAAGLEGLPAASCSEFDAFVAGVHADEARQRADFAAGLWWALQHQGFRVQRMAVQGGEGMAAELKEVRAAIREEHRAAILAAPELDDMQARRLREKPSRDEAEQAALLRYRVRTDLHLNDANVDGEALDIWSDGRGPRRLDRFSAATMRLADRHDHSGEDLALHRFGKARALAYAWLLEGMELAPGMRVDQDTAAKLIGRVIERRHLMAFLGIVSAKWARATGTDAQGREKPFPTPKYAVREVGEILDRMWLDLRQRRSHKKASVGAGMGRNLKEKPPHLCTQQRTIVGTESWYEITAESWERASIWAERRNKGRQTARAEAANDETFWTALRADLWAQAGAGELTWAQACTRLESAWAQSGRRWSCQARVARWWASEVLRPRLAA